MGDRWTKDYYAISRHLTQIAEEHAVMREALELAQAYVEWAIDNHHEGESLFEFKLIRLRGKIKDALSKLGVDVSG